MPKLDHAFVSLLEPDSFKAVETDDEQEVAIAASIAISLKRIADALVRIRVVLERPRR
jgi:hypothetical protein